MVLLKNILLTITLLIISYSVIAEPTQKNQFTTIAIQAEQSAAPVLWQPEDNDIRILEIKISQYVLEEIIAAYQFDDIILIPLGSLSESIGIAINSQPQNNVAEGFIIKQKNTFYLDTDQSEVTLKGVSYKYPPELVHVLLDDIYVESNLLSSWLNFQLNVNLFTSQLSIITDEPLPFQKRIEREKKIRRTLSRLQGNNVYYPRHYEPYKNTSTPFIDQTISTKLGKLPSGKTGIEYNYTTFATADLAKLESRWFLNGNDNDIIDSFRVTLGRKDSESKLLGTLKATDFSFGHIFEPNVNLVSQSSSLNLGFTVSNFELDRQLEYDKHTFFGDLQPDWEVELYHNNSLLGYQAQPIDGQYSFTDTPLLYGSNHFRLVFYGPLGETREETYNFQLGDSLTRVGKYHYRASISEDEDTGNRLVTQFDYGLQKNLSLGVNFTSIPLNINNNIDQHNYLNISLRSFYDNYFFNMDIAKDLNNGSVIELGAQTSIDDFVIGADLTILNNYLSEQFFGLTNPLTSKFNISINTSLTTDFLPRIPISFEITTEKFSDGSTTNRLTNQLSFSVHKVSYNNQLTFQEVANQPTNIFGALNLSHSRAKDSFRGNINYSLGPKSEFTNTSLNYELKDFYKYRLNLSLTHSLLTNITDLRALFNKPLKDYNLSYGARINNNNEISIDINFSIGIGHKPRSNEWTTKARSLASSGSISAKVFIDTDQDGVLNGDDVPLSDVGFVINRSNKRTLTDENGIAFLASLPAIRGMDISVAGGTLEDPLWKPAFEGIHVFPRPGITIELDFPIFIVGEIDGTVYLESNGNTVGIGDMDVEIVNDKDQVINTTQTSYDGFYIISGIPIGQYTVRVNNETLRKVNIKGSHSSDIDINMNSRFINGVDFILKR